MNITAQRKIYNLGGLAAVTLPKIFMQHLGATVGQYIGVAIVAAGEKIGKEAALILTSGDGIPSPIPVAKNQLQFPLKVKRIKPRRAATAKKRPTTKKSAGSKKKGGRK